MLAGWHGTNQQDLVPAHKATIQWQWLQANILFHYYWICNTKHFLKYPRNFIDTYTMKFFHIYFKNSLRTQIQRFSNTRLKIQETLDRCSGFISVEANQIVKWIGCLRRRKPAANKNVVTGGSRLFSMSGKRRWVTECVSSVGIRACKY